jgi:hypothetical protein
MDVDQPAAADDAVQFVGELSERAVAEQLLRLFDELQPLCAKLRLGASSGTCKLPAGSAANTSADIRLSPLDKRRVLEAMRDINAALRDRLFANLPVQNLIAVLASRACDAAAADPLDALYEQACARATQLHTDVLGVLMEYYHKLHEPLRLPLGVVRAREMLTHQLATVEELCWMLKRRSECERVHSLHASDFGAVRRARLVVAQRQPIGEYTLRTTMMALYRLYAGATEFAYDEEIERYAALVFRRLNQFLVRPFAGALFDVADLRVAVSGRSDLYRASPMLLRDACTIEHALLDFFDVAHLLPREPPPAGMGTRLEDLRAARAWLRRYAEAFTSQWVRDNYIELSMRPGEWELFRHEFPSEEAVAHEVMRRFRVTEFRYLTEHALYSPRQVVEQELVADELFERQGASAQRESLHLTLTALGVFRARMTAANPSVEPMRYVVLHSELRQWQNTLETTLDTPTLVLLCNRLQVWFRGRLFMYNCALAALAAWMRLVDEYCDKRVDRLNVSRVLDEFLRPGEDSAAAMARRRQERGERAASARVDFGVY